MSARSVSMASARLRKIALGRRVLREAEPPVADRGDVDERVHEHVLDAELPQLLGQLAGDRLLLQLLLGTELRHARGPRASCA